MSASQLFQRGSLILLLLALSFGIWQTQARLRAEVLYEQSLRIQESWTESPERLTAESWQRAAEDLQTAMEINASNGHYLNQAGLLKDRQRDLLAEALTPEVNQQILAEQTELHLLGIQQQPAYFMNWVYYARSKALAGQLDGTFELALERINTLGTWNKNIQLPIAQIAQLYWPTMSNTARFYSASLLQQWLGYPGYDTPIINAIQGSEFLLNQLCPVIDQTVLTEASRAACQLE